MAKFLKIGSDGMPTEEAGITTSAGAGDSGKIPALDGGGKLDITMMPTGIGADSKSFTTGEALSAGDLVYINASGEALKADANDVAKAAVGFVLSSASGGASATVYFEGSITGLSGLTRGSKYFLSASAAGSVSTTVPSGAGDIVQYIGVATSTTEMTFEPQTPMVRA